jgi:DNA-binding NarL/FixJ family response regulator
VIGIALVDDEPLVRAGLAALLTAEDDLEVVGETDDGAGVLDLVRRSRPDVVLMDVRMPKVDGITATRAVLRTFDAPPRIIVVTTFEHDDHVYEALRVGASGFLLKRTPPAEIVAAIRLVHAGDSLLFPAAIRSLAGASAAADTEAARAVAALTDREAEILRLLAQGRSNAEIAGEIHLGTETVKTHVSSVLAKLRVRDRTQAVIAAYDAGLVRAGEPGGRWP